MPKKIIFRIVFDSYIDFIRGSVGSKSYRHDYYLINGNKLDVLENGNLSCAYYASAILKVFDLIPVSHTTVKSTVFDMEKIGWRKIENPRVGCVLVWEGKDGSSGIHKHIGFYMGDKKAISNSDKKRCPIEHHWTFGEVKGMPKRKVEAIYWHSKLGR